MLLRQIKLPTKVFIIASNKNLIRTAKRDKSWSLIPEKKNILIVSDTNKLIRIIIRLCRREVLCVNEGNLYKCLI